MQTRPFFIGILAVSLVLSAATQAFAQERDGPLARRIQDRLSTELAEREAAARARGEAKVAARMAAQAAQSPAIMAQIRQVQTGLNYFEFDAGAIDGLMGPQTREAIEAYQTYLGFPVTGELTEEEGQFLVGAYQRAEADPATTEAISGRHSDGIKGVLLVYQEAHADRSAGTIPSFVTAPGGQVPDCAALAATEADVKTETARGILTAQFCTSLAAAVAESDALIAGVDDLGPEQVRQQCLDFEPALADLVAALPGTEPSVVIDEAMAFVAGTGQPRAALSGIAETCLGVGYAAERPQLSIGSTLLLIALDRRSFAEFLGHHLALGLGTEQDPELAREWFEIAATSDDSPERAEALRATLLRLTEVSAGDVAMPNVPTFSTGAID